MHLRFLRAPGLSLYCVPATFVLHKRFLELYRFTLCHNIELRSRGRFTVSWIPAWMRYRFSASTALITPFRSAFILLCTTVSAISFSFLPGSSPSTHFSFSRSFPAFCSFSRCFFLYTVFSDVSFPAATLFSAHWCGSLQNLTCAVQNMFTWNSLVLFSHRSAIPLLFSGTHAWITVPEQHLPGICMPKASPSAFIRRTHFVSAVSFLCGYIICAYRSPFHFLPTVFCSVFLRSPFLDRYLRLYYFLHWNSPFPPAVTCTVSLTAAFSCISGFLPAI